VAGRPDWPTLARRALLRHIERGHAPHALHLLRHEAAAQGRRLWLSWLCDGQRVWIDGEAAPDGACEHALLLAGARVGGLWLEGADDEGELTALLEAAAPLVELASRFEGSEGAPTHANPTMLRAALHGAGTFVWDWQVDSDLLPDIEDGFAMLGYAPGHFEPTQEAWNRLIHPDDRAANHEAYLRHARGEAAQYEHVYRALDAQGRWRWLEERGRIVARASDGSPLRMLGTQTDITGQRDLAHEVAAAARDKAAAEAASSAKSEFLSRMSHELRTPLNAVLGFAQLLEMAREPRLAEPHRRHVRLIREAGEHLLAMIGDLLDLTRIESGQLVLTLEPTPLAALVADCVALVQAQAVADGVALIDTVKDGALTVRADRTRLKQVLLNLLSNAIKYNRNGGRVKLAAALDAGWVRIDVVDTGAGIAPEHLARLFEPFQRGAQAHGPVEGTGIGLAVSRSLVELMGGRIEVASKVGAGSTFSVLLPG
jgi:PAS domain S-box-containing protein